MVGEGGHRPPPDREERLDALVSSGRRGKAVSYFLTKVMGAPAFFAGAMRLTPAWARLKAVAHTLPYDLRIMGDFSLPADRLASITVPTLVVHGAKSPDVLQSAAAAVADSVPGANRHSLAGQRHAVSWRVLAPVLTTFFRD
jgi:pimeloyl-ACP methyl ester carboxylesterase